MKLPSFPTKGQLGIGVCVGPLDFHDFFGPKNFPRTNSVKQQIEHFLKGGSGFTCPITGSQGFSGSSCHVNFFHWVGKLENLRTPNWWFFFETCFNHFDMLDNISLGWNSNTRSGPCCKAWVRNHGMTRSHKTSTEFHSFFRSHGMGW